MPGLDATKSVDRKETLPPAAQIVHRQAVSRKGVVNENAVVHSVVLGAEVGDFSFNWIGLINKASNTLAMIVHAPLQQKLKTKDGQQGNVLTRSFLMEYNGAQAETGINTPAETWQIDFTARMAAMDERQRMENIDLYGAAAFMGNGWLVAKNGSQYFVTAGVGYVRGLRAQLAANQNISVPAKPAKVWLDVAWTGTLTSAWGVASKITVAAIGGNDETDIAGSQIVTTGKDLIEKIGQIRKSVAAVQQQIIAPVVWIGSGTINVAQLMLDTLDVVKELAEQTASHTHSNTGAPTNAGAIRNTGAKADTLNGKYSPVIGK